MASKSIKMQSESMGKDLGIPADLRKLMDESGPWVLDSLVRQAFTMCWMMLPKKKRSTQMVVDILTKLFERNIQNFLADGEIFETGDSNGNREGDGE